MYERQAVVSQQSNPLIFLYAVYILCPSNAQAAFFRPNEQKLSFITK